jgi:hypothetical protein
VRLPPQARGHAIVLALGRVNDRDWTYVNGVLVGSTWSSQEFRSYWIRPGDPAYATLNFGGDNVIALQVSYAGPGGGLYADIPALGIEDSDRAWVPLDGRTGTPRQFPERYGVQSWGAGNFFNSWETSRGAFGFAIAGQGAQFTGPLAGLAPLSVTTGEAFTDFAISKPWLFQPLAWTQTQRNLLYPDHGERYPVAARVVNETTHGEFMLVPASIATTAAGLEVLRRLGVTDAEH